MNNVVFECRFGSNLYGTDTITSDQDFKGIYMASLNDIILKKDKDVIHMDTKSDTSKRNSSDDIDIEWKELRRFIKDAMAGQTYALDMLFCTKQHTIETSYIWSEIQRFRDKLLSKNITPFIGYARTQCGKYGLRGSRLGELERVISILEKYDKDSKLKDVEVASSDYVQWTTSDGFPMLKVLEKYYQGNRKCGDVLKILKDYHSQWGHRAIAAKENNGVDFKAVSHAYRCVYQGIELLKTGNITFPLKQASFLKEVKTGKIDYNIINEELPKLLSEMEEAAKKSFLPENPDYEFWDNWIVWLYDWKIKTGEL